MAINHPEMTYEEISSSHGISLRTLKNILSKAGIKRYNKVSFEDENKDVEENVVEVKEIEQEIVAGERQINFLVEKCKKLPGSLKSRVVLFKKPFETNQRQKEKKRDCSEEYLQEKFNFSISNNTWRWNYFNN